MNLPDPVIEKHEGFRVVRDDLIEGGTKRRVLGQVLANIATDEFVYPSTAYGYGPVALAHSCRDLGRQATLIYSWRKHATPLFQKAADAGANIVMTPKPAYFTVVEKFARDYAAAHPGAILLKPGFDSPEFVAIMAEIAKGMNIRPKEVWCAAGSGTLTRALQQAWPRADHHAVRICMTGGDLGRATEHRVSEKFEQAAKAPPPFPSASNYDAKIWQEVRREARPGALVWNVGA